MPSFNPAELEPSYLRICYFPKYRDMLWTDVIEEDRKYVEWIAFGDHDLDIVDDLHEKLVELLEGE